MSLRGWMGSFEVDGFRFGGPEEEMDFSRLSGDELRSLLEQRLEGITQFPDEFWKDWEPIHAVRCRFRMAFDEFPLLRDRLSPEARRAFGFEA